MTSLDSLVQQVLDKLGLTDISPTDCKLFFDKKELATTDRNTPIRLLGLPRGARLDLVTGREPPLGVQDNTAAAAAKQQQRKQIEQNSTTNAPPPSSSTTQQPGKPSSSIVHHPPKAVEEIIHPVFGKYGHSIQLFTRQAELDLEASLATTGTEGEGVEDDDSYFEFTEADFKRVQASAATRRAKEASSTLMTKTMREGQERRNAQLVGDVIIRAELNTTNSTGTTTDHFVVQVTIPATESLGELKRLVFSVLDPKLTTDSSDGGARKKKASTLSSPYLYTAPPKTVLKDDDKMIYSLGLYPAARVHVGLGGTELSSLSSSSSLLRSEAQALVGPPPSKADAMHRHKEKEDTGGDSKGKEAANNDNNVTTSGSGRPTQAGGKPVPKWLKLGK